MSCRCFGFSFLVFILSTFAPLSAIAEIKCVRYTKSHSGFKGQEAFDSWFPPVVFFSEENQAKPKTRKLPEGGYFEKDGSYWKFQRNGVLLPSGQFVAHMPKSCDAHSCYAEVRVKYDCVSVSGNNRNNTKRQTDDGLTNVQKSNGETDATLERVKMFSEVCKDLGFSVDTEKHADCVLRLMQD